MSDVRTLKEENSPCCNIKAMVQENDQCVYFYLIENPNSEMSNVRICWVRNYDEAPDVIDSQGMREGVLPMLPREYCKYVMGSPRLEAESLEIVWFEEGDAAALLYEDEIICMLAGWCGGFPGFPGYSKECIKSHELAMPLGTEKENLLFERVRLAKEFWSSFNPDQWTAFQNNAINSIHRTFDKSAEVYAVEGGLWPPKTISKVEKDGVTYFISSGVSILPQPKVEQFIENAPEYRRIEFGFAIKTELLDRNEGGIFNYLSILTSLPWRMLIWLGNGHSIGCDQFWPDKNEFPGVLFLTNPEGAPEVKLSKVRRDNVNLLWIVPITEEESKFANDNSVDKLLEKASGKKDVFVFENKPKFI